MHLDNYSAKFSSYYNLLNEEKILEESEPRKYIFNHKNVLQNFPKEFNIDNATLDIIKYDDKVTITVNLPEIKKEEIYLKITNYSAKLISNNIKGKYYKIITLPCKVKPKSAIFTYINGVLDIIIKRDKENIYW
jgi:HSP20 family molecular chaperone IbpA